MSLEENGHKNGEIDEVSAQEQAPTGASFDAIARGVANGTVSRRKALHLLAVGLVGSALGFGPSVASAAPVTGVTKCKPLAHKCLTNTDCCSRFCDKNGNKCACTPEEIACADPSSGQLRCVAKCANANNPCEVNSCNPVTGGCIAAPIATPNSVVCREAQGDCDVAEFCLPTSTQCPTNEFKAQGIPCRQPGTNNKCEGVALCPGNSAQCPDNPLLPATEICRPADGPCDAPELCTGSSNQCPEDAFLPAGPCTTSNPTDKCLIGTCSGTSGTCQETEKTCTENQVCVPATGNCVCPTAAPNKCNNGKCITCEQGRVFNAATCSCDCPATAPNLCNNGTCITCAEGRVFNAVTCSCDCPATAPLCGGQCVSTTCSGGQTFNQATCRCECPVGTCGTNCAGRTCGTGTSAACCTGTEICCVTTTGAATCCNPRNQICCAVGTKHAGQCKKDNDACTK